MMSDAADYSVEYVAAAVAVLTARESPGGAPPTLDEVCPVNG
jgi:hypothetical protein